jgi:hypothetical protein
LLYSQARPGQAGRGHAPGTYEENEPRGELDDLAGARGERVDNVLVDEGHVDVDDAADDENQQADHDAGLQRQRLGRPDVRQKQPQPLDVAPPSHRVRLVPEPRVLPRPLQTGQVHTDVKPKLKRA